MMGDPGDQRGWVGGGTSHRFIPAAPTAHFFLAAKAVAAAAADAGSMSTSLFRSKGARQTAVRLPSEAEGFALGSKQGVAGEAAAKVRPLSGGQDLCAAGDQIPAQAQGGPDQGADVAWADA